MEKRVSGRQGGPLYVCARCDATVVYVAPFGRSRKERGGRENPENWKHHAKTRAKQLARGCGDPPEPIRLRRSEVKPPPPPPSPEEFWADALALEKVKRTPRAGSPEARRLGCNCSGESTARGRWLRLSCPLHGVDSDNWPKEEKSASGQPH